MKEIKGFIHSKDKEGNKFTVAYSLENSILTIGLAICSHKDQFCKKIGRAIAGGRMIKNPLSTETYLKEDNKDLIKYILSSLPTDNINKLRAHL